MDKEQSNTIHYSNEANEEGFSVFFPETTNPQLYSNFWPKSRTQFGAGINVKVPHNTQLLVIDRDNPGENLENSYFVGPGRTSFNTFFSEAILVPTSVVTIDYRPNSNDEGGFEFHTDVENSGCDIKIDPAIMMKIVDARKYLSSTNPLKGLRTVMINIISAYTASKSAAYIQKNIGTIDIDEIDFDGRLKKFAEECGIEIKSLFFKKISFPKEIEEARMKTEVAKEEVKTAEYNRKIKKFESETDRQIMDEALKQGMRYGYSGKDLLEFVKMYTNMWLARTPGAQVFVNTSGQQLSGAEMLLQQISGRLGNNNSNNNQQQIIDADAREVDVDDAENSNELEPKKYTKRRL